jgi:hypothetical protein
MARRARGLEEVVGVDETELEPRGKMLCDRRLPRRSWCVNGDDGHRAAFGAPPRERPEDGIEHLVSDAGLVLAATIGFAIARDSAHAGTPYRHSSTDLVVRAIYPWTIAAKTTGGRE